MEQLKCFIFFVYKKTKNKCKHPMPTKIGIRRKFVTNSLLFESEIKQMTSQLHAGGYSHFGL